jgi:hypothetical protein
MPPNLKHEKLGEFFLKVTTISDAKRMNKEEF